MIGGFSVLSFITILTYTNAPPIPERALDAAGNVVFTGTDIQKGQEVFFKYGLMEHGSLWGHGAYLGLALGVLRSVWRRDVAPPVWRGCRELIRRKTEL
jgi:nitric oxide reductase large subunit